MKQDKAKKSDDILGRVCTNFESAEDATTDSREEAEQARDYFDGVQWTQAEIDELNKRKQPAVVDNRIKDKVEYIVGLEAASRSDPKAYPRNPSDEDAAEAATDALRYVAENNDLDTVVSDIAENMFIEGMGGAEVIVERKKDIRITVKRTPWDRMYYDPHSCAKDFRDARYLGSFVWMDVEDAEAKWPDVNWSAVNDSLNASTDTYDDKPKSKWFDGQRRRVRVVEQWYRDGNDWYTCKFIKGEFVEKPRVSPYLNDEGETEHPYCWMSAYVDRDGYRYGLVRRYKTLQDEINHRRSRALYILNSNQIIMEDGAVDDPVKARIEANKPDGVIVKNPGFEFGIEKNTELAVGQSQLLANAENALSVTGPRAVDNMSASQSGRAKQIDNQTDVLQVGRVFDQLRALKRQIYIKIWNRVQQFWTEEKWVRIRDDEGRAQFAVLNQPITALQQAQNADPSDPMAQQYLMQALMNPEAVVEVKNNVTELNVDIIIDDAPDTINLQSEQFANLVSLAQAGVIFPPEVYLEASSLRNKDMLLEKLKGGDNPEAAAAMQQQQMIEIAERDAEIQRDLAKARKDNADAQNQELENALGVSAVTSLAQE